MIRPDGTIHFAEELLDLIGRFVEDYEDIEGVIERDLDRGLVVAFALSAMSCDLQMLCDCLENQQVFGHLNPRRILDECSDRNPEKRAARRAEVARALEDRGWLSDNYDS